MSLTAPVQQLPALTGISLIYVLDGGPLMYDCKSLPAAGHDESLTENAWLRPSNKTSVDSALPLLYDVNAKLLGRHVQPEGHDMRVSGDALKWQRPCAVRQYQPGSQVPAPLQCKCKGTDPRNPLGQRTRGQHQKNKQRRTATSRE